MAGDARIIRTLKFFIQIGMSLAAIVAGLVYASARFGVALTEDSVGGVLTIALAVTTFAYFGLYVYFNNTDLELLAGVVDTKKVRPIGIRPVLVVLMLSGVLGFMLAFSWNILVYSVCAVVFQTVHLAGDSVVLHRLCEVCKKRARARGVPAGEFQAVMAYYHANHPLLRGALILSGFYIALILALQHLSTGIPLYRYVSYGCLIATLVIGEIVIWRWREKRNAAVEKLHTEDA